MFLSRFLVCWEVFLMNQISVICWGGLLLHLWIPGCIWELVNLVICVWLPGSYVRFVVQLGASVSCFSHSVALPYLHLLRTNFAHIFCILWYFVVASWWFHIIVYLSSQGERCIALTLGNDRQQYWGWVLLLWFLWSSTLLLWIFVLYVLWMWGGRSRCPPRYLISLLCYIGLLPRFRWDVSACFNICLEPNIMNSVLSLLSLRHIDIIQSAIVVRVFSMMLIIFSWDVWHLSVKDFLMLWSSANPASVINEGTKSLISEQ